MNRRTFLGVTLMALESLYASEQSKMPSLFCAHGSPMNMLNDNGYTKAMIALSKKLPKPKAVLMISAHWVTNGLFVSTAARQDTIHDFYGFPKPLYEIRYHANGEPTLANKIIRMLSDFGAKADDKRGLDHGGWGVMKFLFPNADVPVFQMSLDKNLTPAKPWATLFESKIKAALLAKDYETLIDYLDIGEAAKLSCPTSEHYLPLLYIAGAAQNGQLGFFYEGFEHGTISLSGFGTNL